MNLNLLVPAVPWSLNPAHSQRNAFAGNVAQQLGIGVALGMRPSFFPHGQGLNADAGIRQDVVGNIVHRHFGMNEMASRTFEHHRHIGVTFRMRRAACAAAKQNGLLRGVGAGDPRGKCTGCLQRGAGKV